MAAASAGTNLCYACLPVCDHRRSASLDSPVVSLACSIPVNDQLLTSSSTSVLPNENGTVELKSVTVAEEALNELPVKRDDRKVEPPLWSSLFPHVPPTIRFYTEDHLVRPLPLALKRQLKWKLTTITPTLVRQTAQRSGFRTTRVSNYWTGSWGKHIKCATFSTFKEYQKVNHFPGSFHLGRKDKLQTNLARMRRRRPADYDFVPETYILPADMTELKKSWFKEGDEHWWIVKPPASARGVGVHIVNRWIQIPQKQPLVVQRYLREPYLMDGTKFDLRIYALVPSLDPLRIYIYQDGLVRFASVLYSSCASSLSDRFMHLTNYSIQKTSATPSQVEGHKWSLGQLFETLKSRGVDTDKLWTQLKAIVVKTLLAAENPLTRLSKKHTSSRYNCYELFGFDILLDRELKPWLLEVNISPSLRASSPTDHAIKKEVVRDMLNLVGFRFPRDPNNRFDTTLLPDLGCDEDSPLGMRHSMHRRKLTQPEMDKRDRFEAFDADDLDDEDVNAALLEDLTPADVSLLCEMEDELERAGRFERVYPDARWAHFQSRRYNNMLALAWNRKYGGELRSAGIERLKTLCTQLQHLPPDDSGIKDQVDTNAECRADMTISALRASLLDRCCRRRTAPRTPPPASAGTSRFLVQPIIA